MKKVLSVGGIVFSPDKKVLLIRNKPIKDPTVDYWGFPKGHIEEGENLEVCALREILEETGVEANIVDKVGESRYTTVSIRDGGEIEKTVVMFLMAYISGELKNQEEEVAEAGWFTPEEALKTLSFDNDKDLLKKAAKMKNLKIQV